MFLGRSATRPWAVIALGTWGLLIIVIVAWCLICLRFGWHPLETLFRGNTRVSPAPAIATRTPTDPLDQTRFIASVLGDTEDRWAEIFAASSRTYHPPKLRLFSGSEPTPCGFGRSVTGPFYCPKDQRIYLDTSFFDDLQHKYSACSDAVACEFPEAYIIAHEVGHHVQNELGILPKVLELKRTVSEVEANRLQVRIELQADCLAGVWANRAQQKNKILDPSDLDEALQTTSAIGDDRLQKAAKGYVVPDSFTHGTSEARKHWFLNGFNSGQVSECNTFSAKIQ
jgi:predicted metalloprotease